MAIHVPRFLEPDGPKLILFGGKGGVGKTTCAAAAAVHLATTCPAGRFLVISTDPAHSLHDCIGNQAPANLEVLQLDAEAALRDFKVQHDRVLHELAVRGTFLSDDEIAPLFDLSLPGLEELMGFLAISHYLEAGTHDRVVIDTAPMGHTLRMLELFEVMNRWLRALDTLLAKHRFIVEHFRGEYRSDHVDSFLSWLGGSINNLANLFRNPARCQFVPVVLPEYFSLQQTIRLLEDLGRLGVASHDLIINHVWPTTCNCSVCQMETPRQHASLTRLRWQFADRPLWVLPLMPEPPHDVPSLTDFWSRIGLLWLEDQVQRSSSPPPPRVRGPLRVPSPEVRVVLVGGKGGVGKTTVACATAMHLAEVNLNRRVLLFSTDPAHSLSVCLDVPVGAQAVKVRGNLTAIEVNANNEFQDLKDRYGEELANFFDGLSGRHAVGMDFDREALESLLDLSPPGVDEVIALTRMADLLQGDSSDLIVVDTAPSGHLIKLLAMPRLVQSWLRALFSLLLKYRDVFRMPHTTELLVQLSRKIKILTATLADPLKSQLLAVAIPTELSLARTVELVQACHGSSLKVASVVINQLTPSGGCALCEQLARQESVLCKRVRDVLPELEQVAIERGREPRGLIRLLDLGRALYRKESAQ